jgi:hypothetical protein
MAMFLSLEINNSIKIIEASKKGITLSVLSCMTIDGSCVMDGRILDMDRTVNVINEALNNKGIKTGRKKDSEGKAYTEEYTEYIVYIRKLNNEIFELKYDNSTRYDYFNIGDYLHYHGSKYLNYFEKYDKSLDTIIFCASCGSLCDIRDNYCDRCGCILLN